MPSDPARLGALCLATLTEAFNEGGHSDSLASRVPGRILTVVDGRDAQPDEVAAAPEAVRQHLRRELALLLRDDAFLTALPGALPGDVVSQARLLQLRDPLRGMAT